MINQESGSNGVLNSSFIVHHSSFQRARPCGRPGRAAQWQHDFPARVPEAPMSQVPPAPPAPTFRRHAWGWPAGGVPHLLALGILGLLWAIVLIHPRRENDPGREAPAHALALLASPDGAHARPLLHGPRQDDRPERRHGAAAGPAGRSIRFVLAAGYVGLCEVLLYNHADFDAGPNQDVPGVVAPRDRRGAGWPTSPGCSSRPWSTRSGATRLRRRTRTWKRGWRCWR